MNSDTILLVYNEENYFQVWQSLKKIIQISLLASIEIFNSFVITVKKIVLSTIYHFFFLNFKRWCKNEFADDKEKYRSLSLKIIRTNYVKKKFGNNLVHCGVDIKYKYCAIFVIIVSYAFPFTVVFGGYWFWIQLSCIFSPFFVFGL